MRRVVVDTETDGLLPELTRLHCLVLRDMDTNQVMSCTDDDPARPSIRQGLAVLRNAEMLYGHNIIYFDIPAIQKVYPDWTYTGRVFDTLLAIRMWKSDISLTDWALMRRKTLPPKLVGSHSLKAWGYRLGVHKGAFSENADWSHWTEEMQVYCDQDTNVTRELVILLRRARLSPQALETEHELAFFLAAMERNGFPLDIGKCEQLYAQLAGRRAQLDAELRDIFGSWIVEVGPFTPKRSNRTLGYVEGCTATKVKVVQFNPGSRDHMIDRLKVKYGWVPTEFTEKGKPRLDDEVMGALPYPEAPKLAEYLLVDKRIGQLAEGKQAWMKLCALHPVTGMQHVHGRINQLGAVTHRATHSKPNMSATPKAESDKQHNLIFGPEGKWSTDMRNVWTVPKGWTIVGADASGLELRNLAHYMARYDGGAYVDVVLNGDIHAANRDALGLEGPHGRHVAKNGFIYPFLYGAGDPLIGSNLVNAGATIPEKIKRKKLEGEELFKSVGAHYRDKFLKGLPALSKLIDACKGKAASDGYFTVLDGRRITVRHEHAALNSLLQSAGAVICKRWLVESNRLLTAKYGPQGWNGKWAALVWSHDEVQIATRPEIAEDVAGILVDSIRSMTQHFAFRCPLDGEAKIGATWAQTH
jgi:DNA polymerase I-like protein with 3'-5' exonuclease and polymerase domains